jgi:hypothetical protein
MSKPKKKIVFSNIESLSSSTEEEDDDEIQEADLAGSVGTTHPPKPKKCSSNQIFKELIINQIDNIPSDWKLNISDMKRICKYIDNSIFDEKLCCMWKGYITNINNSNKGTYINFYFRNKKVALHRLLYSNYVEPLDTSEYLKFKCVNKGICCNVNHYEKYKYSKNAHQILSKIKSKKKQKKEISSITIVSSNDPDALVIDFE